MYCKSKTGLKKNYGVLDLDLNERLCILDYHIIKIKTLVFCIYK